MKCTSVSFAADEAHLAQSIASQASIAIQNAQLVNSIRQLFEGFISASVQAIESRDPTTSGHSQRVATLTVALAEHADRQSSGPLKDLRFTREMIDEVRYASLLHDFGKIGVREEVLVKAKKLYPQELQTVEDRFDMIRYQLMLNGQRSLVQQLLRHSPEEHPLLVEGHRRNLEKHLAEIEELLVLIHRSNEPTVLDQQTDDALQQIATCSFQNLRGETVPYLSAAELNSLSVARGSLNSADRKEIESHVTHTYLYLKNIPWTADLRNIPEIAYAHHEKLNGSGYPRGVGAVQIPVQSRMMTISDIYDALTALDRPYKKALPTARALDILHEEAQEERIDTVLLDLFVDAKLYRLAHS